MFDALLSAESSLVSFAQSFDAALLSGEQSLVTVDKLGRMQRLIDGLLAMAAKRVDDTYAYKTRGAKDAAQVIARSTCGTTTAAQAAINVAKRLEALPVTNAAVRAGRLSSRATEMIVNAAVKNPARESELIAIAARGLTPLKDACIRARAEVENPRTRRARQHKARYLRTWTDEDGLYRGSFALAPEEGGQVNAVLDERTREVFRSRRGSEDREELEAYAADAFVGLLLEHEVRVSSETSTTTHRVTNASHPTGSTNTSAQDPIGMTENADASTMPDAERQDPALRSQDRENRKRRRTKVNVHIVIDHAVLVRGSALPGERCEIPGVGPVSTDWVREILADAFVTAIISRGKNITTVTHLGRHINAELKTALLVSGRECDIEGCTCRGYLEIDHSEVDFAKSGPTALWNLGWLCSQHHTMKSSGWSLGPRSGSTRKRHIIPPERERSAA